MLTIKRIYELATPDDGYRVLVDRLWPRGLSKDVARVDEWLREISPSDALRRWFGHEPARWETFVERYRRELAEPDRATHVAHLRALAADRTVTLLYSARDKAHNNAVVIADVASEPHTGRGRAT